MSRYVLALFLCPALTAAQVTELGDSLLASASATMPGCTDTDGGADATEAAAACSTMVGYAAAGSARASFTSSTSGGTVDAFAQASAASIGPPATQTATGAGDGQAVVSWTMGSDTLYSLSTTISGGASASFSDGMSGPLPPSGTLPPDIYELRASASALAQAQDLNGAESVTAGPREASARVTFAPVGSPTLIRGTVLAGGVGTPGLLVEALDGGTVVASTLTGDDGSYLLDGISGPVRLRISDPEGGFASLLSDPLSPPATLNADLEPIIFADGFESM